MSNSTVKPIPPNICWAVAVTSRKVWQANSLAIGASLATLRPSDLTQAASWTRTSAPSTAVEASAMLWASAWNAPSGLSNWWRSFAYCTVIAMAYWAPPTAWAAARMIPSCITASQVDQPVRGPPMRSAAVTRTRSRSTRYWLSEPMVICWVRVTPCGCRIDHEQVDVAGGVTGPGQDHQTGGRVGEGHVTLGTGDDQVVAVGHRGDLHALGSVPVLRLQPCRGEDRLTGDQPGQPLPSSGRRCRPGPGHRRTGRS